LLDVLCSVFHYQTVVFEEGVLCCKHACLAHEKANVV